MATRFLAAITALALAPLAPAQQFTPGNLLATSAGTLYELDRDLQTVRSWRVPTPPGARVDVVDVTLDALGRAHVLETGVGAPGAIATYDPVSDEWTLAIIPAFLGNISDGDITFRAPYLFTKSQRIELPGFDLTTIQLTGRSVGEISAGLDGRLFALDSGSPRPGIRVVDPETLDVVDTFGVPFVSDLRGIGSLPNGEIVVADWDGMLKRYTSRGETELASVASGAFNLLDVSVAVDGTVAAGGRFGDVVLTDANFSSIRVRQLPSSNTGAYTTIVPELGPNVGRVTPATGSWRGPGTVEIEGRFFARSPILAVRFGDREATDVTVVSDTLLRCTPPAALPGPVDVVVESALPTVALERGFVYTPGIVTEPTVAPGTVLALDVALERPGDFVVVVLGTPTQNGTTIPGIDRTLDVANETVLWIVPSWPGTSLPVRIPIADDPSLIGVAALFQAASGVPGRATWSNAVRVEIAR